MFWQWQIRSWSLGNYLWLDLEQDHLIQPTMMLHLMVLATILEIYQSDVANIAKKTAGFNAISARSHFTSKYASKNFMKKNYSAHLFSTWFLLYFLMYKINIIVLEFVYFLIFLVYLCIKIGIIQCFNGYVTTETK